MRHRTKRGYNLPATVRPTERYVARLARCDVAARDLLMPYGDVVIVLSTVLLDGAEIDKIIWEFEAQKALAIERRRRADWRKGEVAASRFRAECDHPDAAASS